MAAGEPSKRPNPGHILALLNDAWGRRNADQVRTAIAPPPETARDLPSPERRAEMAAEVARLFLQSLPAFHIWGMVSDHTWEAP